MLVRAASGPDRTVVLGIVCTLLAWLVFSLHDASVKLLVDGLSPWQVLFFRSAVVMPICLFAFGRQAVVSAVTTPVRCRVLLCAAVYAAAWLCYFTAARGLQLAELETIYYASPLITTVLAVLILREAVPSWCWAGGFLGFAGVMLACGPIFDAQPYSIILALAASALWALAVVLLRGLAGSVPTSLNMLANNALFLAICGVALPWWWQTPTLPETLLALFVGGGGALAQFLLYEGIRQAPANVVAPLEYTGICWAFILGFLIWGDMPAALVFLGAALIIVGGMIIIYMEWRQASVEL